MALVLNRTDVARYTNATSFIGELRDALLHSDHESALPVRAVRAATAAGSDPEEPARVELLNVFARGGDGQLEAILEASRLRALQQALVGAIAVEALSLPTAATVALLGAAPAAAVQLKSLRLVRSLSKVLIVDADAARALALAHRLFQTLSLPAQAVHTVEEAVTTADIVLVTQGVAGALSPGMLREGTHVNALAHASALSPRLLAQSRLFTDVRSNVERWAVGQTIVPLADVLSVGWRRAVGGVSLFVASDPPLLDDVAAWHVLQAARSDVTLTSFDFAALREAR